MRTRFFNRVALVVATVGIAVFCTEGLVRSEVTGLSRSAKQVTDSAAPSHSAEMLFFGYLAALTVSKLVFRGRSKYDTKT
jgi:hypothetical protein